MAKYLIQDTTLTEIADAIRSKTGSADGILVSEMASQIAGISGGGGDVRYVTFMDHTGTVELGKKAVAVGDDCADPIARGVFDTPTRESDAQYNYTHIGWANTPGGGWDENILKAIAEDKTVYAAYAAAVRSYTIRYYDGETLLKNETLAYGSMPSYVADKEGFSFKGWEPALATVTGDATYYAQFDEKITFAGGSWADLSEIAASGNAADSFAVGDSRIVPVTLDGTTYSFEARIVGFNHDTVWRNSKKEQVGVSILFFTVPSEKYAWKASGLSYSTDFYSSDIRPFLDEFYNGLPDELKAVIKGKYANYNNTGTTTIANNSKNSQKVWVPSSKEIAPKATSTADVGTLYELFANKNRAYGEVYAGTDQYSVGARTPDGKLVTSYGFWCRDGSTTNGNYKAYYVNYNGTVTTDDTGLKYVPIGFCI